MKTPGFWKDINFFSNLFAPLGWIYGTITALRLLLVRGKKIGVPVVCVGNLTAGGVGKTPVSVSIAQMMIRAGKKPFFITRGYGGKLQDIVVNKELHTPKEVGDEPLILAQTATTVVNKDRYLGAFRAADCGADMIIMDDGFQNPGLYKNTSFIVVDGNQGFGNNRCIPAGPLREFIKIGLMRADAVLLLGETKPEILKLLYKKKIFRGKIVPIPPTAKNKRVIAFAGIGHPQKFYKSLEDCGFEIIATHDFADHHFYTEKELNKLFEESVKKEADLYTTSKDFVKIPTHLRHLFNVLEITVEWENPEELKNFILRNRH